MAVGDEPGHQVNEEVERAAMARMLDLAAVLELIDDALDDRTLAQQEPVGDIHQDVAHILASLGDEPHAMRDEKLLHQRLGDVALVAEELAEESPDQARDR